MIFRKSPKIHVFFLPWIEHDGNLKAFGFLPVLWIPKKLALSEAERWSEDVVSDFFRIPKMTVFFTG